MPSRKVKSEQALLDMATESWRPVILRNGTLFGIVADAIRPGGEHLWRFTARLPINPVFGDGPSMAAISERTGLRRAYPLC